MEIGVASAMSKHGNWRFVQRSHRLAMKSFSAFPGFSLFMKFSPMRNTNEEAPESGFAECAHRLGVADAALAHFHGIMRQ